MKAMMAKFLLVAFAVLMGTSLVRADSITVNDVQFTATVTSTTATLQIQCLDTSVCGSWYLGDVTLKGLSFTGTPTLDTAPSGYTLKLGGQNNNAVGNGGGCDNTQLGSALCWDASLPLTTQLGGGVITFSADLTGGSAGTLAVQATAYNNSNGYQTNGGKVLAVSQDFVSTPEPGTLALLALGLGSLALVAVRRRPVSL